MPNPTHAEAKYQAVFSLPGQAPTDVFHLYSSTSTSAALTERLSQGWSQDLNPLWWDDVALDDPARYHPHGATYYTVRTPDGQTGTYLEPTASTDPNSTEVLLTYTDLGLTPAYFPSGSASGIVWANPCVQLAAYLLVGNEWVFHTNVSFPANAPGVTTTQTLSLEIHIAGYYRFIVSTPTVSGRMNGGTLSAANTPNQAVQAIIDDHNAKLYFSTPASIIGFSPIPHLPDLSSEVMGIRVTAVSGMITPHPAMLYEGGQCCGVQLPGCCSWDEPMQNDDPFSFINSLQTSTTLKLASGLYAFHKPTDMNNFDMQMPFIFHRSEVAGTNNPMIPPGGWLVFAATVPMTDSAYPSGSCHLTTTYAVEFQTTNTWFNVLPPSLTPADYDLALEILRTTAQWHENPLHMKEILRTIASKGAALLRVAPSVLKVIGALFPGVAVPAAVANAAVALGNAL